jgi:Protein of unknown function (DUF2950)/Protein of unknown function (DUF3300)
MRAQAQAAGTLQSNSQQTVTTQGQTIIIQPADPQVIYVPQYNPTVVYGEPVAAYPGYSGADLALTGVLASGAGIAVGALISSSDGWGYNNWNTNWHGGNVTYNKNVYVSNTNNYHAWNNNSSNWNKNTKDYVVDGRMTGGFAVLAYPAKYRSTGVMTFLVDADGNVLQNDLGPKTDELAKAIDSYSPDGSWAPAQ